jgi:stress response protein YsnF
MRTVRALFEREADAKTARERLRSQGVPPQRMSLIDRRRPDAAPAASTAGAGQGLWASLKEMVVPADTGGERFNAYLSQGGFLLTASVPEEELEGVIALLGKMGVVDYDTDGRDVPSDAAAVVEERIPLAEEHLIVGRRERDEGGVRVHAFATERPVHERVHLVGYRVRVERRPVDRALGADADPDVLAALFSERSVELTETAEEVLFEKEARVREEVVVRKERVERVEHVSDTVRSTEVEVERLPTDGDLPAR